MPPRWLAALVCTLVLVGGLAAYKLSSPSLAPYVDMAVGRAEGQEDLTVRFFGTTTLSFNDRSTAVMIDGFFTRPGPFKVFFGKVEPNEQIIKDALKRAKIDKLAAVFVAHSHYDHALDSAAVALSKGATVYGSLSTASIMRGSNLPAEQIQMMCDGARFSVGSFHVSVFETPHSPNAFYMGSIYEPLHAPANASDYKEGGSYSFLIQHGERRILVVPSANFIRGKFQSVKADTVFLGIGTLGNQDEGFISAYWNEVVKVPQATLVIPIHWDDFMRPLNKPLRPMPRAFDDFAKSMRMLSQLAKRDGVALRLPEAFEPISLNR